MNRYFTELLNYMIPKIGVDLSGSCVWKSDQHGSILEEKFLIFLDISLNHDVQAELAINQSNSGSLIFELLQKKDKSLLKDVGDRLIENWFTHPEVLKSYGLPSEAIFPHGKKLNSTDWSILEPVFLREKLYRE